MYIDIEGIKWVEKFHHISTPVWSTKKDNLKDYFVPFGESVFTETCNHIIIGCIYKPLNIRKNK